MDVDPEDNAAIAVGCIAVILLALKGLLWAGLIVALIYWLVANA